jgi:hypothetical protein
MHVNDQVHAAASLLLERIQLSVKQEAERVLHSVWTFEEEMNLVSVPGFETRIVRPVAGLHYPGSYRSLLLRQ